MRTAASLARRLDGQRQGHNWRLPCPLGCGYTLSLYDAEDGTLLAHCFGGCGYNTVLSALVEHGLFDDDDDAMCRDLSPAVRPRAVDEAERVKAARWLYSRLPPAVGTTAATYLRARGIKIDVPSVLRFGTCPHRTGGMHPAMAAPVVNVDGDQIGIHMTYLRADGSGKAFARGDLSRECRGVVRGGAIRLAPHDPDCELLVAEGIETTMSAMQLFELGGWSAVSAGGLRVLELPLEVRRIVIAADNDTSGTGQRNALAAYERWCSEGRSVRIKLPPNAGDDFNDVIRRG